MDPLRLRLKNAAKKGTQMLSGAFLQNAAKLLMDLERLVRSFAAKCWRSL
jgi:hypothetical protein